MTEPVVPVHHGSRRLVIALAVTAIALPLLVLDNVRNDGNDDATTTTAAVVAPADIPGDRPETGPSKGISVVTSSTTSSTQPIIATTTTLPD